MARRRRPRHRNKEHSLNRTEDGRQILEAGAADKESVFSEIQQRAFQRLQEVERTIDESLKLPGKQL